VKRWKLRRSNSSRHSSRVSSIVRRSAGKNGEELRAQLTEQAKQMREQIQNQADARDKQLASILTPKQMARLKELDLQWRGRWLWA